MQLNQRYVADEEVVLCPAQAGGIMTPKDEYDLACVQWVMLWLREEKPQTLLATASQLSCQVKHHSTTHTCPKE